MWVTIYVASMAVLLLACSIWAAWKRDAFGEAIFAGGAGLLVSLVLACFGASDFYNHEKVVVSAVGAFMAIIVFLICHAFVVDRKDNI
jgi:uncharacterized MnhB-related membrane protein